MASYYYLISSLPMLKAEGEMPIKYDEFLSYCKDNVSVTKLEILKNLTVDSTEGPLVKEWGEFYGVFKNELTNMRKIKLGIENGRTIDKNYELNKVISSSIGDKNPLEAEKALLAFQFEKLDSLIGTHIFDDYALFGYALKLKLLERKTVFNQEKGKSELSRLVKGIENQIESIN